MKLSLSALALALATAQAAYAAEQPVKIGVLADVNSGYSDIGGKGLVEAARMAVEDFGGKVLGQPIELIYADGQNKVDVASATVRRWFDQEGVDMVTDLPTSAIALGISELGRDKKKIVMVTSAAASDVTGKACSPYTIHWTYDTYALANGTSAAVTKQGGDNWFFLTADYSFGHALQTDASAVIQKLEGKVLGAARAPRQRQRVWARGLPVWSADIEAARAVAERLECGTVWINHIHALSPMVAFGGHKQSGVGVENSLQGLLEYTNTRTISLPA